MTISKLYQVHNERIAKLYQVHNESWNKHVVYSKTYFKYISDIL